MKLRFRRETSTGPAGRLWIGGLEVPVQRWTATTIDETRVELTELEQRGDPMTSLNPDPQRGDPAQVRAQQHENLIRALEAAVTAVEEQDQEPVLGRTAAAPGAQPQAVALPSWLTSVLQAALIFVGPHLLEALERWIAGLRTRA